MNRKIVIITGAGQGIGGYIVENLDKKFDLLLISKSKNCINVSKKINKTFRFKKSKALRFDLNDNKKLEKYFNKFKISFYKEINIILCAAKVDRKKTSFNNYYDWIDTFKTNFFSNISFINLAIKKINKKKLKKIMIFSGGGAASSFEEFPIYSATKTALVRTVENYALKFRRENFNIFAIAPGAVETKMLKKVKKLAKVKSNSSLNQVFNFINFCLKNKTNFFNGKLIHIRDNIAKIKKNNDINYLKLRRVE